MKRPHWCSRVASAASLVTASWQAASAESVRKQQASASQDLTSVASSPPVSRCELQLCGVRPLVDTHTLPHSPADPALNPRSRFLQQHPKTLFSQGCVLVGCARPRYRCPLPHSVRLRDARPSAYIAHSPIWGSCCAAGGSALALGHGWQIPMLQVAFLSGAGRQYRCPGSHPVVHRLGTATWPMHTARLCLYIVKIMDHIGIHSSCPLSLISQPLLGTFVTTEFQVISE